MAVQLQLRRGTTEENDAFTGAVAEVTVDTEAHELRVHDGFTQGGFAVPKKSDVQPKSKSTVAGTHNYISEGNEVASNLIALDTQVKSLSTSKADSATTLAGYGITDGTNTNLSNLTSTGANIANWSSNVSNCITEIPQDINLELNNGTLTLKAGSKVYVPNGAGVFDTYTAANDITSNSFAGSVTRFVFVDINNNTINAASAVFSGTTAPTLSDTGFWYDTTNNVIKRTTDSGATWTTGYSFPIAIVTSVNDVATSIDQVFNGFGYIGSTIFALPGVKGLMPSGRNADGTLNNTAFTVNNVITKTTSYDFGFDCNFMIRDGSTIDYVKNSFYLISEKTPSYKQYARLYQTTKNKCYYGEPSSWEPIQFVFCGTMTLDSNGKIIKFDSRLVFEAVDSTERDYVVDYQRPTAENNYTWYRKYKSGWVEQGGYVTTSSDVEKTVSLPVQMDNVYYDVQIQREYASSPGSTNANLTAMCVWGLSTTEFKCWDKYGTSIGVHWEVKGKAA